MAQVEYFFDTYAIIELLEGNPRYAPYAEKTATITIFNLAELFWNMLLKLDESEALEVYEQYRPALAEIDDETLKEAVRFRLANKKKDMSYADCIGYIYAKRHGLKFLTGDKEFETLPNVEFIK